MKFGVGISIVYPLGRVADIAVRAEELGYESFWLHENPMVGESFSALVLAAERTRELRLGTACVSVITRHPIMTASSAVTLQNESGGRFILGLGLGGFPWLPLIGYPIHPVEKTRPLRRIMEGVQVVRSLTNGGPAEVIGAFYHVKGFRMLVRPVKPIPVYVASMGPKTLRSIPRWADGAITSPGAQAPEEVARMLDWVRQGEVQAGRRVEKAAYVTVSVAQDRGDAYKAVKHDPFFIYMLSDVASEPILLEQGVKREDLEEVREAWRRRDLGAAAERVTDPMVEALTASGTPVEARRRIEEYLATRMDLAIITPIGDYQTALQVFAPK